MRAVCLFDELRLRFVILHPRHGPKPYSKQRDTQESKRATDNELQT